MPTPLTPAPLPAAHRRTWLAGHNRPIEPTMPLAADIVIALIALLHGGFLILEMFLWTKPAGRRVFGLTLEFAQQSRVLAANQGLYNGFLAAGLMWGLSLGRAGFAVKVFSSPAC
jgi:Predicted membrane protein